MESINWISPSKDRSNPCLAAEKMENIYIYIYIEKCIFFLQLHPYPQEMKISQIEPSQILKPSSVEISYPFSQIPKMEIL